MQQIDASDVGLRTIFSPKMQSRQLEPPVSLGPPLHLGQLTGAAAGPQPGTIPHTQPADCGTGTGVAPCIFPRAKAQASVACRYQDLGSPEGCALFSQILLDTWKNQDFPKPGILSLLWITLQTGPVEVTSGFLSTVSVFALEWAGSWGTAIFNLSPLA